MKADLFTSKSVVSYYFDIALFSFFFYSILSASDNMFFFPNLGNAFYLLSVLSSLHMETSPMSTLVPSSGIMNS